MLDSQVCKKTSRRFRLSHAYVTRYEKYSLQKIPTTLTCIQKGSYNAHLYHLIGLVVKASTSRAEDPGFESRCDGIFLGVE